MGISAKDSHERLPAMIAPYYTDAAVTLYHGDCLDVLPQLEPVDHVITDPPYAAETHAGARGGAGDTALVDFASVDDSALLAYVAAISPLVRRWFVATVDWRHMLMLEARTPTGLRFVRFGVWVKPNGAPQFTGDRPATGWEAIAMLHALVGAMRWNGGGRHGVYHYPKLNVVQHPTEKPIGFVVPLISDFTDEGETILDPFAGSGTTGVAAKLNGRKAILIEREEKYAEIAAKRLAETEPGRLFDKLPRAKPQSLLPKAEIA